MIACKPPVAAVALMPTPMAVLVLLADSLPQLPASPASPPCKPAQVAMWPSVWVW